MQFKNGKKCFKMISIVQHYLLRLCNTMTFFLNGNKTQILGNGIWHGYLCRYCVGEDVEIITAPNSTRNEIKRKQFTKTQFVGKFVPFSRCKKLTRNNWRDVGQNKPPISGVEMSIRCCDIAIAQIPIQSIRCSMARTSKMPNLPWFIRGQLLSYIQT